MEQVVIDNAGPPELIMQFVDQLDSRPVLFPHLTPIWEGFHLLSNHRPSGFGVEAIPAPWLYDWCDRQGMRGEEQEAAVRLLSALDRKFCEVVAAKQKADAKAKDK